MRQCASDRWRMPHTDGSASSTVPLLLSCSGHGLLLIASTRSQTFLGENILTYTRDPLEIQRTSTRRSMMVRLWVSALREARIFEPIVLAGGGRGSPAWFSRIWANIGYPMRPFLVSSSERHFIKPAPQVPFFSRVILPCFCDKCCVHTKIFPFAYFYEGEKGKHSHDARAQHCHACLSARVA